MTSARRRSPRDSQASSSDACGSFQVNFTFEPRSASCSNSILVWIESGSSKGTHWMGVCGLGMKVLTPACTRARPPAMRRPSFSTARHTSAIACTSERVSWGCPIIKYSLSVFQPCSKTERTVLISSSSLSGLLMMLRIRSVPASGAKVNPPPGDRDWSTSIRSSEKDSIRSDGRVMLT